MATRGHRDSGKKNLSSSDSSFEKTASTRDSIKEKKTSAKPDSKKSRQEIGKENDDQTSIKQFTENTQIIAQSDLQSVMSQLTVISENMIKKDDLEHAKNDILSNINERMEKLELRIFTLEVTINLKKKTKH